jgi:L-asparagine transporter-like permease
MDTISIHQSINHNHNSFAWSPVYVYVLQLSFSLPLAYVAELQGFRVVVEDIIREYHIFVYLIVFVQYLHLLKFKSHNEKHKKLYL